MESKVSIGKCRRREVPAEWSFLEDEKLMRKIWTETNAALDKFDAESLK